MSWTIRSATTDDAELAAIADLVNAVTPESPTSVEDLRWQIATYPDEARFVAENDGAMVGAATVGRIYIYPPEFERHWVSVRVLPAHRRQGIGTALLVAGSGYARTAGKIGFQTSVSERQVEGIAFLEHHGFTELERDRMVQLDLTGLEHPSIRVPDGIELTTLAARPDLLPGVHAVAEVAFRDIPSAAQPISAGTLDEFRARDVDRPGISADAFQIAVDAASGEVVGYASLMRIPGRTDMAWHDMTAVHREHRGRGIATALKTATIAWAIDAGLAVLETGNDVHNAPMRAVNARLGYQPIPDEISFRGPLVGARDGP
jgi:mycothiol synthase